MQLVFQAVFEFILTMMVGPEPFSKLRLRPMWQRILLFPLIFAAIMAVALVLTFIVFLFGAFLLGVFRGLIG